MEKEQAIKEFKQAYAWMVKAQRAAFFTKGITVEVQTQYCAANDYGDSIQPFTCTIVVLVDAPEDGKDCYSAEWMEWRGTEKFNEEKELVRAVLRAKGVNI